MLAFPRVWGYVFNPLTVYYGFDAEGALAALLYEVKNTFGEQVAYALPAGPAQAGLHAQRQEKALSVSPFIGMDQTYRFAVRVPDERLSLRIRQAGPEGETLIATLNGRARPFTDAGLLRVLAGHPLMSLKVTAAIHWQALRLYAKGLRPAARAEARGAAGSRRR
jgi:DUF1365 family protein